MGLPSIPIPIATPTPIGHAEQGEMENRKPEMENRQVDQFPVCGFLFSESGSESVSFGRQIRSRYRFRYRPRPGNDPPRDISKKI